MESWRKVFREGIAPALSLKALEALAKGLSEDDPALIQGATTTPPPLACIQDWDCEAACPVGYSGWKGEEIQSVGEVEEFFARVCFDCDQRIGEPAAIRWFLNWADETPRNEMRAALLGEVSKAISQRLLEMSDEQRQAT